MRAWPKQIAVQTELVPLKIPTYLLADGHDIDLTCKSHARIILAALSNLPEYIPISADALSEAPDALLPLLPKLLSQAFLSRSPALVLRTLDASFYLANKAVQSIRAACRVIQEESELEETEAKLLSAADAEEVCKVCLLPHFPDPAVFLFF